MKKPLIVFFVFLSILLFYSISCSQEIIQSDDATSFTTTTIPKVKTPQFSFESGTTFKSSLIIDISSATRNAIVMYSFDSVTWITGKIVLITETTTLYAKATMDGMVDSDVVSATYINTNSSTTTTTLVQSTTTTTTVVPATSSSTSNTVSNTTTSSTIPVVTTFSSSTTSTSSITTTTTTIVGETSTTVTPTTSSSTSTSVQDVSTTLDMTTSTTIPATTSTSSITTTTTTTTTSSTSITTTTVSPVTSSSITTTTITPTTIDEITTTTTLALASTTTVNVTTTALTSTTLDMTTSTTIPVNTSSTTVNPTTSSSTSTSTTTISPVTSSSTTTSSSISTTTTTTITPTTSTSTTTTTTINISNYFAMKKFAEPFSEQPCIVNLIFGLKDYNGNIIPGIYDTSRYNLMENSLPLSYGEAFYRVKERTLFDVELKTVIMIDISYSVGSINIEKLKDSVKSIINNKSDNQSIAIYTFSGTVTMVKDFSLDKSELIAAVNSITLGAVSTNLYGAIYEGLDRFTNTISNKLVTTTFMIVMTDGQDTSAVRTLNEILTKRGDKSVITVGIGNDVDPEILGQIGNFGSFMSSDFDSLQTYMDEVRALITETFENVCWMTYYSPKRAGTHTIELSIKDNSNTGENSKLSGTFSASSPQFYDVIPGIYVNDNYTLQNGISELNFSDSDTSKTIQVNSYFGENEPVYTLELSTVDSYSISEIIPATKKSYSLTRVNGGNVTLTIRDTANSFTKVLNINGAGYVTLDFNSQNGSVVDSQTTLEGNLATQPSNPTRIGYTFAGWFKESGCINQWNFGIDTVDIDTTLFAKWTTTDYNIIYNLNEGTNGSNPATYTIETSTITLQNATKDGYTFGGWYSDVGLSNQVTTIALGSTGDKTLYSKWSANTCTVTFDKQSGTGGSDNVNATYGLAMPSAIAPTKNGYTFIGYWDATSDGVQYYNNFMGSVQIWDKTSNDTLYARWTANTYTVTLDKQSGSGGSDYVTATYGLDMPSATVPSRTGYSFNGYWDSTSGGTQYYNSSMGSLKNWDKIANATLYARWTGNQYTVTFDKQSGTGGTDSVTATYNTTMPTATSPSRAGYTFTGYWDATSGGLQYYTNTMSSARTWSKITDATLYARWSGNKYTVTFDKQNGTGGSDSVLATYGSDMPTATAPTRTSYTFIGFWDAVSEGIKYYNLDMSSEKDWDKLTDTTLYARWAQYTVTYDGNGHTGGSVPTSQIGGEITIVVPNLKGEVIVTDKVWQMV